MITLLASIAGFFTSILPEFLKFFRDKVDKKHELEILDRQIEYTKALKSSRLEEIQVVRDMADTQALYSTFNTGYSLVDSLNGSVRPILAYCFFGLYSFFKYIQFTSIKSSTELIFYLDVLWSLDDQAIFACIISFYFGQRMFRRFKNK